MKPWASSETGRRARRWPVRSDEAEQTPAGDGPSAAPVGVCSSVTSSRWVTSRQCPDVGRARTSMWGLASMRAIRYRDMVSDRSRVRISNPDLAPLLGHIDGGLPGGIAPTDHDHVAAGADPGLEVCGRVVHAGPLEALELLDLQSAISGSRGDDHRPAGDLAAVGRGRRRGCRARTEPDDLARCVEARPEALGLDGGRATGPPRRSRWGSRRSSRCASWRRPGHRRRRRRGPRCRGPPTTRRPLTPSPAGPVPITTRSKSAPGTRRNVSPRCSANSPAWGGGAPPSG